MGWDTFKDNMNAFIGAFLLFISLFFIPEIKRERKYLKIIAVLIIFMVWLGCDKINRDNAKDREYTRNVNSLKSRVSNMESMLNNANRSLSSANTYLKRLDSMGIKRDVTTNMPVITKNFTNNIGKVNTLNQY